MADGGEAVRGLGGEASRTTGAFPAEGLAVGMERDMKLCRGLRLVVRVAEQVVGELEHGAQSRERGTEHVFGTLWRHADGKPG
jgi:hypothetical protein